MARRGKYTPEFLAILTLLLFKMKQALQNLKNWYRGEHIPYTLQEMMDLQQEKEEGTMSKESDQYEKFIAGLIKDISETHRKINFLCPRAPCRPMGSLGQKHQIDVAFIDETFIPRKLVLIECKLKNPKYHVGPEVVKIIAFNGGDLIQNPEYPDECLLIICSTSDFSSGAKRLGNALNIKLERVDRWPDYTFRYENIILAGVSSGLHMGDDVSCTARHPDGTED